MSQINHSDLDDLAKALEQRRKDIEEDERAIARVRKLLGTRTPMRQNSLPIANLTDDTSFKSAVIRAVKSMGALSFTVPMVEEALIRSGFPLPEKSVRPRISMIIKSMLDEENASVELVKKGVGNMPFVYRNRQP